MLAHADAVHVDDAAAAHTQPRRKRAGARRPTDRFIGAKRKERLSSPRRQRIGRIPSARADAATEEVRGAPRGARGVLDALPAVPAGRDRRTLHGRAAARPHPVRQRPEKCAAPAVRSICTK